MNRWRRFLTPQLAAAVLCTLLLAARCERVQAQTSVLLDPSARSGGMGGAGAGVAWGGAANLWANPALVTAISGFSVQVTGEQLVPGLGNDVQFNTTRLAASFAGLGISSAGRPLGSTSLDLGIEKVDFPVPLQEIWVGGENMRENGIGISAASLADAVAGAAGHPGKFADWGDVAWGRQWKRIRRQTAFLDASDISTRDEGWLVRVAPFDSRRGSAAPVGGLRVELACGHALLDDDATFGGVDNSFNPVSLPIWHVRQDGGALRLVWYGPARGGEPAASFADAFRGGLGPLTDLTLAYDREHVWLPGEVSSDTDYRVTHYGAEVVLLRVLALRAGYVDDPAGQITKPTWGLGACLPLSRNGEVRYDFASWPQAYARRVYRHEISLRVDPLARWLEPRDPGSEQGTGS